MHSLNKVFSKSSNYIPFIVIVRKAADLLTEFPARWFWFCWNILIFRIAHYTKLFFWILFSHLQYIKWIKIVTLIASQPDKTLIMIGIFTALIGLEFTISYLKYLISQYLISQSLISQYLISQYLVIAFFNIRLKSQDELCFANLHLEKP